MTAPGSDRLFYRRRHRLTRATEFQEAYCHGCRESAGPLTIYLRPNGLADHRLGLSVGRRVGGAVKRNRVKRLLREAFRLERPGFSMVGEAAFDIVIQVRPHRRPGLADYQRLLTTLVGRARAELARREAGDATK